MKFLHVLGEIFSTPGIIENPSQPRQSAPEQVQKAEKTVKNHGTFAAVICFVPALRKSRWGYQPMTQIREPERRARVLRGRPYSLDEFAAKYGLRREQAESLFTRFGPSSIELDLLMAAKRRAPVLPDRIAQ